MYNLTNAVMLEGPISTRDRLLSRPEVDDDDIPGIIARADAMQSEAKAKLEGRASVDEVIAVGRELDIEDQYVEAAIDELRVEREPKPPTPRSPSLVGIQSRSTPQTSPKGSCRKEPPLF
jgi:hypothetical protein